MELMEYDTIVVAITGSGLSAPTVSVIVAAMLWKKGITSICAVSTDRVVESRAEDTDKLRTYRTFEGAPR